ncbi:hypothetical protein EIP91_004710 [Steccherinum ochraceum]|uniref:Uncharacterized protein n=1 Tax=Steccherinum ochraceum TaxID=92696 RepID=A0A4V6N739_9APHY|nr:hypothetical protein EIP91_004710 [Steccherinum ochraceum]
MLSSFLTVIPVIFGAIAAAQSNPTVVCVAGQCLQGFTNTTIGATLSSSGSPVSILLLPGQYDANTNPQLLHTLLTSASATLAPSPGFANGTSITLPLTMALQPGLSIYPQANFSGSGTFTPLPENNASISSSTFSAGSIMVASNVWAAVASIPSPCSRSSPLPVPRLVREREFAPHLALAHVLQDSLAHPANRAHLGSSARAVNRVLLAALPATKASQAPAGVLSQRCPIHPRHAIVSMVPAGRMVSVPAIQAGPLPTTGLPARNALPGSFYPLTGTVKFVNLVARSVLTGLEIALPANLGSRKTRTIAPSVSPRPQPQALLAQMVASTAGPRAHLARLFVLRAPEQHPTIVSSVERGK